MERKATSVVMLTLLLIGMLTLAFNIQPVEASGTIYIRADGGIDPPIALISTTDNVTYIFVDNIYDQIVIERSSIIIDGDDYTLQGSGNGTGFSLSVSNVTIRNTNIKGFDEGISISGSSGNTISGNNITANSESGISLYASSNHNSIHGNTVTNNRAGIYLDDSSNNSISGNNITNNVYGIRLSSSSNNNIYHNNLIDNIPQAYIDPIGYTNTWDDGYPSGGNYWSDYTSIDLDYNGIGDTAHEIDADNRDRYPLMGPFNMFDAGTWDSLAYNVDVVSNSTISNFQVDTFQKTISFNATGVKETAGFCRITVPNIIVQELWQGNYTVLLNGEPWPFRKWTDATNTYIYINYTHSEHEIIIVPEFPSAIILPLCMILTMFAIVFMKRKILRKLAKSENI